MNNFDSPKNSIKEDELGYGTKNTPGAIRTRDPLLRRQMLYPAELPRLEFVFIELLIFGI